MQIEKYVIDEHNHQQAAAHKRKFEFIAADVPDVEQVLQKLMAFQVTIPSWALGTGGTRFGRFSGGGEPGNLADKIDDVGLIHALNKSSDSISLHIPWDIPGNAASVKAHAAQLGLRFDAVNSNTFQDQPNQALSYKFGSLHHVDKGVRKQAIEHNIEVIKHGVALGSNALSVWLSDGSNFPGQLNFRTAFQNTLESLGEIYSALPEDWKVWIEYKPYEPNFYSTTIADWGQSYLLASKLGAKASTLVDLGHHLQGVNIEQIVSLLLMEGKLAGFHFNDSKYGDDDLTVGSINPYQLFLIFNELVEGMDARGMNHSKDLGWMIDASHNVKDPIEDLLQSVQAIKMAYAQALIIDKSALVAAQKSNDVAQAQEILQQAYRTDVRPLLAEARLRAGGALDPIAAFRKLNVRAELIKERGEKNGSYRVIIMKRTPVIAIFDVGKTNKKLFLFDQDYKIVYEKSARFTEVVDEDGFPCENVDALKSVLFESLNEVYKLKDFEVKAINFSTYGASFVYVGEDGNPVSPLYNYLKPYPQELQDSFYAKYGGETKVARETASPVLGNLNSGMQLYRIKHQNPKLYKKIKHALHLPQYMSYLLTGKAVSDITSVGCHTNLWDFDKNQYHQWVIDENLTDKLAPVVAMDTVYKIKAAGNEIPVGIGLHDSSAALIPYLANFHEPFMLLSTGTWCISLNPFNHSPLTADELNDDCLCYMDYHGKPVKASRLFAGHEHEVETTRIAAHFNHNIANYRTVEYAQEHISRLKADTRLVGDNGDLIAFAQTDMSLYQSCEEAYHHLAYDLVRQQVISSAFVLKDTVVKRIFVDGGFSKNSVYMNLLALAFADMEVFAASMPQATALGTALAIHSKWNTKTLPANLIELNYYAVNQFI